MMMKHLFILLFLLLGIHGSFGQQDEPTQEPTHETISSDAPVAEDSSDAPSVAEDISSVVPTIADDVEEEEEELTDPTGPPVPDVPISTVDEDFTIAEGALDGIQSMDDPFYKMGPTLAAIYKASQGIPPTSPIMSDISELVNEDGTVSIDAVAMEEGLLLDDMVAELELIGFVVVDIYKHVVSGNMPVESLGEMCECDTLIMAMPALAVTEAGSVTSQGVKAMYVDKVLESLDVNGAGITVGVLSDSYDALGGAAQDIRTGDLPPPSRIKVLNDTVRARDEGRAMMQHIHDVAPGANLAFHTAYGGQAVFANGIKRLAEEAGCRVIVDDIFYTFEPAFQDGIIAQAVDEVRSKYRVAYFASAGNYARQSYEYPFVSSGVRANISETEYLFHDFNYGSNLPVAVNNFLTVHLPRSSRVTVVFQWDEPFKSASPASRGSSSDLGIFIYDLNRRVFLAGFDSVNIGADPIEGFSINTALYLNRIGRPGDLGYNFDFAVGLKSGKQPGLLKVSVINSIAGSVIDYPTNSGSGYGHRSAAGSAAVGAAFAEATTPYGVDPPLIERLSSANGVPILMNPDGARLPEPIVRKQPKFTGPDGTSTTFFGFGEDKRFFGTSAAAPHVAGVAALMLEADPELGPRRVHEIMEETAIGMIDPTIPFSDLGFDYRTGHGFVNGSAAVQKVLDAGAARKLKGRSSVEEEDEEEATTVFSSLRKLFARLVRTEVPV